MAKLVVTLEVDTADHAHKIVDAIRAVADGQHVLPQVAQDFTAELGMCLRQFGAKVQKAQVK